MTDLERELKDMVITELLEQSEPDQILIDVLKLDLHELAEQELEKMDTKTLLKLAFEGLE